MSPPACYLEYTKGLLSPKVLTAGQNSYKVAKGAFTGDLSPQMLIDVGADWVILGHSERRNVFGENDQVCMHMLHSTFVVSGIPMPFKLVRCN